jgi:hypothetical protein
MKRYADDVTDVTRRAREVAGVPSAVDRYRYLDALFGHAGDLAHDYADPAGVLQLLVTEAANSHHDALNARRLAGRI